MKSNNQETPDTSEGRSESDLLEEYNYFAKKKQESMHQYVTEKRKLDAQRRKAKRDEELKWRIGGKEALKTVSSRVGEIRFMLQPHNFMRQCMGKLSGYQQLVPDLKYLAAKHDKNVGESHYLMDLAKRERYPLHSRHNARTTVMHRKVAVMRDILLYYQERHPFEYYTPESFALRHRYAPELKLYRFISRYYAQRVSIPTEMRTTLARKRRVLQEARDKLKLIHDTQSRCAKINVCKSRQHFNPKGCSNCGVIFMGGSLEGAIAYVKSVSRVTGVATLVTLDFEVNLLAEEEKAQIVLVKQLEQELFTYEQDTVYLLVAYQLQPWWASVILHRRYLRKLLKKQHSLFYYRIRRLVRLKKDVDQWIIAPAPIDCVAHGAQGRYVDLVPELEEYVSLQQMYKRQRIDKYARRFRTTLKVLVEEARERKYREWLRQQEILNRPKPIVIKTLMPADASVPRQHEHYRCYRASCCRRLYQNPYHANIQAKSQVSVASFLTKDRYMIHLRSHQKEDDERRALLEEHKRLGHLRQHASIHFLRQLREVRQYLLEEMHAAIRPPHATTEDGQSTAHTNDNIRMSIDDEILSWANEDAVLREKTSSDAWINSEFQESLASLPVTAKATLPSVSEEALSPQEIAAKSPEKFAHHRPFSLFHHSYQLLHLFHPGPRLSLTLVSKHSSVTGPSTIPLDRYLVRIGTTSACELQVSLQGITAKEKRIQDIHCLLYIQDEEIESKSLSHSSSPAGDTEGKFEPALVVRVVDNYSRYGTYVVGENGARKVSTRLAKGSRLTPGALLCIGVQEDGPAELSVADASLACVVYKFNIEGALNRV